MTSTLVIGFRMRIKYIVKYDFENKGYHTFGYQALLSELNYYDYVVCDECYYFLAGSNYNTDTGVFPVDTRYIFCKD